MRDRTKFRLMLLVLVAALSVALAMLSWGWPTDRSEPLEAHQARDPSIEWIRKERTAVTEKLSDVTAPDDLPEQREASAATNDRRFVRFVFTAQGAATVSGLKFRLKLIERQMQSEWSEAATDDDGSAEAFISLAFSSCEVIVTDDHWEAERVEHTFDSVQEELRIQVHPLWRVHVVAHYDDGEPFLGPIAVSSDAQAPAPMDEADPRGTRIASVEPRKTATVTIRRIRGARDIRFSFRANGRPGYDNYYEMVSAAQIKNDATLHFTIPRSKWPKGNLVVDVSDVPFTPGVDRSWTIEIIQLETQSRVLRQTSLALPIDRKHLKNGLRPGIYQVTIVSGDLVGSETIEIRDREESRCAPKLAKGASVVVTILGNEGEELNGAVLYCLSSLYVDYPASPIEGSLAVSNGAGQAMLHGVLPHQTSVHIEAQGYEPTKVPVVLAPGRTYDLGRVTLKPAAGRITVTVKNALTDNSYSIQCRAPASAAGGTRNTVVTRGEDVEFAGIPLRRYIILARHADGGGNIAIPIELTAESPEQSVEIDLNELPATPRARLGKD